MIKSFTEFSQDNAENKVVQLFYEYLDDQDCTIQECFDIVLEQAIQENVGDTEALFKILLDETVSLFAEAFDSFEEDADPQTIFKAFAEMENLSDELQKILITYINFESANSLELNYQELTPEKRIAAVKLFLLRLCNSGKNFRDLELFLQTDQEPSKDVRFRAVKQNDNWKNKLQTLTVPVSESLNQSHPLAAVANKYNYHHLKVTPFGGRNDTKVKKYSPGLMLKIIQY